MEWTRDKFGPNFEPADERTNQTLALLTPNVLRVVREHLGCETLTGAELEDDWGSNTAFSHWEERIFQVQFHIAIVGQSSHEHYIITTH